MLRKTIWQILGQDLAFALKTIRRSPGFAAAVVIMIALGIAANTAMFSVVRAVLLKPLPYHEPDQLVLISEGATPARADELREASHSYAEVGTFAGGFEDLTLSGAGQPEQLKGARVSANFLGVLGLTPSAGRGFISTEDQPEAAPVAMISAELWRRRFAADPGVIGRTAIIGGAPTMIVGVLPSGFQFPLAGADVWLTRPAEWSVLQPKARPLSPFLSLFGRLKPGISISQATAELALLNQRYAGDHAGMLDAKPDAPEIVVPLKESLVSDIRPKLWMLFGAVGFVLLIVCANVGGLLLARAASRAREFAVRAAIGAGRYRIIGQLLAENVLLASLGGALGIVLAAASLRAIRSTAFIDLPRAGEVRLDGMVFCFGAALALITGLLFGLMPALAASTPDIAGVLRGSGEGKITSRPQSMHLLGSRGLLVVGQVALSIVLLIGATLLMESLGRLYRVDPGFQPAGVLTMKIALPQARYDTEQKRATFYERLAERTRSLPGVSSAALATTLPMSEGWMGTTLEVAGRPEVQLNERPIAIIESITPDYLQTLAIPLRRGRDFTVRDNLTSIPVAIINESAARIFWPDYPAGINPLGQHVVIGNNWAPLEIVGIAADVHQTGKDSDPKPAIYVPCLQKPPNSAALAVRTTGDPLSFANAIRGQVLMIDPDQPVSEISTMQAIVDDSEGQRRLMMRLLATFAAVATILALVGLYGVISYSVAQRTKEIGIRRALGAQNGTVLSLVIRQVLGLALVGILLGMVGALVLTRLLSDLLFQVSATDATTFCGIGVLFVFVALVATWIPARRATQVDPVTALRMG